MKTVGFIMLLGGILFGVYALTIDTSVQVNYNGNNALGLPDRVNNLGLMSEKQNYLIFSGILALVGAVIYFSTKSSPNEEEQTKEEQPILKKCPQCAEEVKSEAKICRFCNYQFPEDKAIEIKDTIEDDRISEEDINQLHNLITEQKKKFFASPNDSIPDMLRKILKNKAACNSLNEEYKKRFNKDIIEHLTSISSAYGTIYFYIDPFIELDYCESQFPHKVIINESLQGPNLKIKEQAL